MRLRKSWFILLILFWVLSRPGIKTWWSLARLVHPEHWSDNLGQETYSDSVFVVHENEFITIKLPAAWRMLRILTNAMLQRGHADEMHQGSTSPELHYVLEYQILDQNRKVIFDGDYHCRTRIAWYHDPESDGYFNKTFFANPNYLPAATRTIIWSRQRVPKQAAQLRLRLKRVDTGVASLAVRAYSQNVVPDRDLRLRWHRMEFEERRQTAGANIYPPNLLSSDEIRDLMRGKWSALWPVGIQGIDYQRRTLYTLKNFEGQECCEPQDAAGVLVSSQLRATVPVPTKAGRLQLKITRHSVNDRPVPVRIHWYRPGLQPRTPYCHNAAAGTDSFELDVEGGLVEIAAQHELYVRAFWKPASATMEFVPQEITPRPIHLRTYLVDSATTLEYQISHVRRWPTPFRVSIRTMATAQAENTADDRLEANTALVHWELVDTDGQRLRSGQFNVHPNVSRYDSTTNRKDNALVSDPVDFYFALEPAARRMRFRALRVSALLACYTRPPNVTKLSDIPEDYSAFHRRESGDRSWFITRPLQYQQLLVDQRWVTLIVQSRPTEANTELLAGNYQWEDYQPSGSWSARQLLVPREAHAPYRPIAASTTYCQLKANHEYTVKLTGPPQLPRIIPRVVFEISSPPQTLRFYVDETLRDSRTLHSSRGEISLPPIRIIHSSRPRRICIKTRGPAKLFLNHVVPEQQPSYIKRLANRFQGSRLTFRYDKLSVQNEVLAMRYFRPTGAASRLKVRIKSSFSRSPGPSSRWTLTQRIYRLPATESRPVIVVNGSEETVTEGQLILLPLGDDLPAGSYTIDVESLDEEDGYLMLYKTTAGLAEDRRTLIEQPL